MAGRIPQHFIDELLNRIDIVDIIDAYVPLKKAGKDHQACCPFHDEKTPSFTVSQQKQFYHCFGCGANGTAISFLMEYLHMGFIDAIEDLASRAGMEIPREVTDATKSSNQSSELYELMEMITNFYSKQLRQHPQANTVIDYLKGRGISGEIAKEFELGFAPPGWDNLINELGKSHDAQKRLFKVGAIIQKDQGGYYDRFRNRLMFPIRDQRGRAIGLGGRLLDADDKPKYLNSPETPIFHKGRELYGLYQARKAIKDTDCLYIVEGYMDVIALAQYGICNAVASLGTAATPEHMEKLFRITNKLVFCFDGDNAGRKAAWRAMENSLSLLREGKQLYFMFLPEGEDPDSFVRHKGSKSFTDNQMQIPLSEFLFSSLNKDLDLKSPEGRSVMVNKTLPYLSQLPIGPYQDILIQELANLTHCEINDIQRHLSELSNNKTHKPFKKTDYTKDKGIEKVRWLVRCLLHQPSLVNQLESIDKLAAHPTPGINFLCELIEFIQSRPNITLAAILENWRDTKFERRLRELAADEETFIESKVTDSEFLDAINGLIKDNLEEFKDFKEKHSPSELSEEQKAYFRNKQKSE